MPLTLRELKPSEIPLIYPLIKTQNPRMTKAIFTHSLKAMLAGGYRAVAVFDGKRMVGCSGFWIGTRFWCGRQLDIDNFVIDSSYRGGGVGSKLVAWLEKKAADEKCDLMVLDCYVDRAGAHTFYYKQGFVVTGYHFTKMPGSTEAGKLPFKRI